MSANLKKLAQKQDFFLQLKQFSTRQKVPSRMYINYRVIN